MARDAIALLGGGVIGGGWAARFLLNGFDVRLYDPDPGTLRRVEAVVANARRALRRLTLAPLPREGRLVVVDTVGDAVAGAAFVQESAPERLDLKRSLLQAASRAAGPEVVIASSTSGLRPSLLQDGMAAPERLVVGHPFNPVYLLPLVEVCGGSGTSPRIVEAACERYRALGMRPLVVRTETDGFIADRLLEALWREALWLVHDDVATAAEVDDAITFGAGLRWAAMGTFMTYRLAGGEQGMRHFMAQFGPTLAWPWTHLTDVPELDAELLSKLVAQSDAQAGGRSAAELERLRDDCLVAVLGALRSEGHGAGEVLAEYEQALRRAGRGTGAAPEHAAPLRLHEATVEADWLDDNGHAHESRYVQVFGDATDAVLGLLGVDASYVREHGSYFTVESHTCHLREATAGDRLVAATQVLAGDARRLHLFHTLVRAADGEVVATAEQLLVHVGAGGRRAAPATGGLVARVAELVRAQASLPPPSGAGRRIGPRR